MSVWLMIYLAGMALVAVWMLREIRNEPPASKVLVLFVGAALGLLWPVVLASIFVLLVYWLIKDALGFAP